MNPVVEVRAAHAGDVEAARQLTNESWLATYTPLIGEDITRDIIIDRHSVETFQNQFEAPGHMFLVSLKNHKVVGHCYAFEKDGLYIDRLHVLPDQKGQGTGRLMLAAIERAARQTRGQGRRIWLDVLRGNDAAMGFYERVGFERVAETDACGGLAGRPAVIFEKTM